MSLKPYDLALAQFAEIKADLFSLFFSLTQSLNENLENDSSMNIETPKKKSNNNSMEIQDSHQNSMIIETDQEKESPDKASEIDLAVIIKASNKKKEDESPKRILTPRKVKSVYQKSTPTSTPKKGVLHKVIQKKSKLSPTPTGKKITKSPENPINDDLRIVTRSKANLKKGFKRSTRSKRS